MVTATNMSENLHSETLLLFDNGRQIPYISAELKEKLKIPAVKQKKKKITSGQSDFLTQTVDIVAAKIKKGNAERFVEAIYLSVICSELLNQNVTFFSQNFPI